MKPRKEQNPMVTIALVMFIFILAGTVKIAFEISADEKTKPKTIFEQTKEHHSLFWSSAQTNLHIAEKAIKTLSPEEKVRAMTLLDNINMTDSEAEELEGYVQKGLRNLPADETEKYEKSIDGIIRGQQQLKIRTDEIMLQSFLALSEKDQQTCSALSEKDKLTPAEEQQLNALIDKMVELTPEDEYQNSGLWPGRKK